MSSQHDATEIVVRALKSGSIRTCAKLISRVEQEEPDLGSLLGALYRSGQCGRTIGVTGPPGAGKSSLVNKLLGFWRKKGMKVAVLAVDPSSPFSGGAILGDRFRMVEHSCDDNVFIRSMASRGQMGGLAKAVGDALTILNAMPWDYVIVETVGAGQSETDIMRYTSAVILVQTPMGGDDVQAAKAGINEIGDIYVVNKSDHPDAGRTCAQLEEMIALGQSLHPDRIWCPPVVKTQSLSGEGIEILAGEIENFFAHLKTSPEIDDRRFRDRLRHQIRDIASDNLARQIDTDSNEYGEKAVQAARFGEADPYTLAARLLDNAGKRSAEKSGRIEQ